MLDQLYGEMGDARMPRSDTTQYSKSWAMKAFKKRLIGRRDLNTPYYTYRFFHCIINACCCFNRCLSKLTWIRNGINKYHKFELALERLSKEVDIQYLVEMNRVSRLVHKACFFHRQCKAVQFADRYVITNQDMQRAAKA